MILRLLLAWTLFALPAMAELPQPLTHYVSDFADVLNEEDEIEISSTLKRFRAELDTEVTVVTIQSPRTYGQPDDVPHFATQLFNQWGVGSAERHDGILMLLAMENREIRIALGSGYPPVWDGRAHRVIEALMLPLLSQGQTGAAVISGLAGIEDYILGPYRSGVAVQGTEGMPEAPSVFGLDTMLFIGAVVAAFGFVGWGKRHRIADSLLKRRPCPNCGRMGIVIEDHPAEQGSSITVRRSCPHCNWASERSEEPPTKAQDDDRGGDGFGGGQSSGGGASGRW